MADDHGVWPIGILSWPELKQGELPLATLLVVMVIVVGFNFRSPGKWVDLLLLLALAGTGAFLAIVFLT